MRRPVAFKEADVVRAVRGAIKAGLKLNHVEIDANGRIVMFAGSTPVQPNGGDSWADVQ